MVFRDKEERLLQVVVTPDEVAGLRVQVFSRPASGDDAGWTLHATASATAHAGQPAGEGAVDPGIAGMGGGLDDQDHDQDQDQLRSAAASKSTAAPSTKTCRRWGSNFGPAFQGMRQIWSGGPGEALGDVLINPAVAGDADKYLLHPALLDACFHAAVERHGDLAWCRRRTDLPADRR